MRAQAFALRERRQAAEKLSQACLAYIANPPAILLPFGRAFNLDPNTPDDQIELLRSIDGATP